MLLKDNIQRLYYKVLNATDTGISFGSRYDARPGLKNATITGNFGFVFQSKFGQGNHVIIAKPVVFEKLRFQNVFRPH